jgi:hypothetical protein
MRFLVTILAFLLIFMTIHAIAAHADQGLQGLRESGTYELHCNEFGTGSEAEIRVKKIFSTAQFEASSWTFETKLRIEVRVGKEVAVSEVLAPPLPSDVTLETMPEAPGIGDTYQGQDGAQFEDLGVQFDTNKREYPTFFLRLRATVPKDHRSVDERTQSAFSQIGINLSLPEERLRDQDGFQAFGYMGYWLNDKINDLGQPDGFTLGLANFKCVETKSFDVEIHPE